MKLLTRAFADWCHEHNIPLDKVVLVVRATDESTRDRIEHSVMADLSGLQFMVDPVEHVRAHHHLTLNGVRVSFSTLDRSRTQ